MLWIQGLNALLLVRGINEMMVMAEVTEVLLHQCALDTETYCSDVSTD